MNLHHIENLAHQSKKGDNFSKQELSIEFKPFIINLSLKYKIQGYDFDDLMGECYKALFTSLKKYDTSKNTFVAFGMSSIRNHLKNLLRDNLKNTKSTPTPSYTLENTLVDEENLEDKFCEEDLKNFMKNCFKYLKEEEKDFLKFVYFQNKSVRAFALKHNIKYSRASSKNRIILQKLKVFMTG